MRLKVIHRSVPGHSIPKTGHALGAQMVSLIYSPVRKQLFFFGNGRALQIQNLLDGDARAELP